MFFMYFVRCIFIPFVRSVQTKLTKVCTERDLSCSKPLTTNEEVLKRTYFVRHQKINEIDSNENYNYIKYTNDRNSKR